MAERNDLDRRSHRAGLRPDQAGTDPPGGVPTPNFPTITDTCTVLIMFRRRGRRRDDGLSRGQDAGPGRPAWSTRSGRSTS